MTPTAQTNPLGSKRFKTALLSLPLVALAVLLLRPTASRAESRLAGPSGKASASIHFRIVVPPVMRVLENSHPTELRPSADGGALTAEQRLVVFSNMKHGFCVSLRQPSPELAAGWQLQQTSIDDTGKDSGAVLSPQADGYRLCTSRPGRHTLLLQHAFPALNPSLAATALHWPVRTELHIM